MMQPLNNALVLILQYFAKIAAVEEIITTNNTVTLG